jgi:Cu/Ag efflux protein CusF
MNKSQMLLVTFFTLGMASFVNASDDHSNHHTNKSSSHEHRMAEHSKMDHSKMDSQMTRGVVRRIDRAAGKITIKHDEIKQHEMPPMTMIFMVLDKEMLADLKKGDEVRFVIDKDMNITHLQKN